MNTDWQIVDLIERTADKDPFCACGRPTSPIWRDGSVWLECTSLMESPQGRFGRLIRFLSAPAHTHTRIVEVPPALPGQGAMAGS